jgi:hypothetical protein
LNSLAVLGRWLDEVGNPTAKNLKAIVSHSDGCFRWTHLMAKPIQSQCAFNFFIPDKVGVIFLSFACQTILYFDQLFNTLKFKF